jgi:hypothetical protein
MADLNAISPSEFKSSGKVLLEIPVLWAGWELDDKAWVVERNGERRLIVTSHGGEYFVGVEFLTEKLAEYCEASVRSQEAIDLLAGHTAPA